MPPLCGLPMPAALSGSTSNGDALGRTWSRGGAGGSKVRPLNRKIVVVGDGACGKTSLLNVFAYGNFPMDYEPTVFENHTSEIVIEDTRVQLSLWDTAGQEDFARLRSLSYADTNVVLLCYSIEQPVSLENIEAKWVDEILEHCPGVKLCLVALKCDLREDHATREKLAQNGDAPVEYEQGLAVAKRIRASRYLECSAKHNRGVRECFEEAARVSVTARRAGETRGSGPQDERDGGGCAIM
ncbi:hypothetical protein JCM11641_002384 [Rhodosporidiobolus odoratus]